MRRLAGAGSAISRPQRTSAVAASAVTDAVATSVDADAVAASLPAFWCCLGTLSARMCHFFTYVVDISKAHDRMVKL
jgi:hypothetical protein